MAVSLRYLQFLGILFSLTQKATGDGDADDDGDDDDEDDDDDGIKQKNGQIPSHTVCQKRFLSI